MASLQVSGLLECSHTSPLSSSQVVWAVARLSVMATYMQVQCPSFLAEELAICSVNDREQVRERKSQN